MKSSSVPLKKQDDYVGSYIADEAGRYYKRVYGLNIEGRARDLTSHNLILLIMSYPISGARESMYTRDEFSARAIYMRIWNMHPWLSPSFTSWLKYHLTYCFSQRV